MNLKSLTLVLLAVLFRGVSAPAAESATVRFGALGETAMREFFEGRRPDVTLEFRRGDELPLRLAVTGDLLESAEETLGSVRVKRTFFLKVKPNRFLVSLDGVTFRPHKKVVAGSLEVGVSGPPAAEIQINGDFRLRP